MLAVPAFFIEIRHGEGVHQLSPVGECGMPNKLAPLTPKGREEMRRSGEYVLSRFERIDEVFTSTYLRAQQSVGEIFHAGRATIDDRLDELWHGVLHELPRAQVRADFPEEIEKRERDGWFKCKPLRGESCEEKVADLRSFHRTLSRRFSGKTVLAVYHGNAMLLSGYLLQNLSVEEVERRHRLRVCPNASITIYEGKESGLVLVDEFLVP